MRHKFYKTYKYKWKVECKKIKNALRLGIKVVLSNEWESDVEFYVVFSLLRWEIIVGKFYS